MKKLIFAFFMAALTAGVARANDTDLKLSTQDGSTKISFVNSSGVEVASITSKGDGYFRSINTSGNIQSYRITADTQTSAAILTPTTLSFSINANEDWSFEMNLFSNCPATPAITFGIGTNVAPAALRAVVEGVLNGTTAKTSDIIVATGTATTTQFNTYNNSATPNGWERITGEITAGAGATTVTLLFASPNGTLDKVMLNSYVIARKLVN
jgi:hypothetical protein